jgi:hypothetical protein
VNTLSISCIHASVLQSVHTTSNHWNICWTDKEYQVENILEKRMISEKAHYLIKWKVQHLWKHMRTHRKPQWLHKNTSALWEGKARLNCQKLFDMLSKAETRSQAEEFLITIIIIAHFL